MPPAPVPGIMSPQQYPANATGTSAEDFFPRTISYKTNQCEHRTPFHQKPMPPVQTARLLFDTTPPNHKPPAPAPASATGASYANDMTTFNTPPAPGILSLQPPPVQPVLANNDGKKIALYTHNKLNFRCCCKSPISHHGP